MRGNKFWQLVGVVFTFSLILGACAQAPKPTVMPTDAPTAKPAPTKESTPQPIVQTDGLNREVTLAAPAQRIVSLAPSNTEILFAIGSGAQVVGRDDFSDYPAEAAKLPSIGGSMGKYNLEAIVALKPDLVLASQLNTPEQVQALESLGVNVYLLSNPADFAGLYQNLATVAKLTGHEEEADKLVTSLKERVAVVEEKVKGVTERPIVFYELDATDPSAPYTSGPGTFIDIMIMMAGGENLGASLQSQYASISLEELLVKNPGIILLGDSVWGGVTPEAVAKRTGWEKLNAVQENRVYPFDDNLVSRPGPRMVDGLEALTKLLHPELYK